MHTYAMSSSEADIAPVEHGHSQVVFVVRVLLQGPLLKDRATIEGLDDQFRLKEPCPVDRLSGFLLLIDEKECAVPCLRCASCYTLDDDFMLFLFSGSPVFV